ncbi:MAG: MaoC family dehydratase N-terminal domain-containing protein [Actinobacteria bacterium]|nr:MaoC family dehydratase N-terminal domain-containing protein [Actinomycetota bacterium]
MAPRPLSSDLVGTKFEPMEFSWSKRDAIIYALGVGCQPDGELDFVYERRGPAVLPTYAVIPGMNALIGLAGVVELDFSRLLHGEQGVTLHRDLPPKATIQLEGRIVEIWDKEKSAVIGVEGIASDDDGPIFSVYTSLVLLGQGGFGGERGPSGDVAEGTPERAPDIITRQDVRPEQAAIYRLSGDANPMHIDPDFAAKAGFDGPFLHGLCTFGFVGRAVLDGLCEGDVSKFGSLRGRFVDQVWPGDTIITKQWLDGEGSALIEVETDRGITVLSQAKATLRPES